MVRARRDHGHGRRRARNVRSRTRERARRAFRTIFTGTRARTTRTRAGPMTVALVTGGGSGIGEATVRLLAARGAQVVVADVNERAAQAVAADVGTAAAAIVVDVSDGAAVEAMVAFAVERFGALDWACNIAGVAPDPKPFVDHLYADWQRTIDVNLSGLFFCMQHELRQMLSQRRGGAIVNMSSGAGIVPAPGQPQYTAAKHGVLGLTKQAAQ